MQYLCSHDQPLTLVGVDASSVPVEVSSTSGHVRPVALTPSEPFLQAWDWWKYLLVL